MMCLGWCWNRAGADQITADVDIPTLLARALETARNASRWRPSWTTGTLESRKNISGWKLTADLPGVVHFKSSKTCKILNLLARARQTSPKASRLHPVTTAATLESRTNVFEPGSGLRLAEAPGSVWGCDLPVRRSEITQKRLQNKASPDRGHLDRSFLGVRSSATLRPPPPFLLPLPVELQKSSQDLCVAARLREICQKVILLLLITRGGVRPVWRKSPSKLCPMPRAGWAWIH